MITIMILIFWIVGEIFVVNFDGMPLWLAKIEVSSYCL